MDEHDLLAERFEANRAHLRAVAYRMLGLTGEAEDAVQETLLPLGRSGVSGVGTLLWCLHGTQVPRTRLSAQLRRGPRP